MSDIDVNLQKIQESVYGKDVRQAIHDAIHDCYEDGKAGGTDLIARERINEVNQALSAEIANVVDNYNLTNNEETLWTGKVWGGGATGTLTKDISYFDYLDLYFDEQGYLTIRTIPVESEKTFTIRDANISDTDGKFLSVSEISITFTDDDFSIENETRYTNNYNETPTTVVVTNESEENDGDLKLVKVVGRKYVENLEVSDIRIGENGTEYASAGEAVRGQIANLNNAFETTRTIIGAFQTRNLVHYLLPFEWLGNKQRNTTGAVVDRTGWETSIKTIPITPDARYYTNVDVFVYYDSDGNYLQTQDRAEGSTSIKVPNNSSIACAYINCKSISDASTKYVVKEETGYTGTWLIEHAQDYEIIPNENIVDSTDENLKFRNMPIVQFGESALFSKRLTAMLTGEKITQDFLNNRYGSMGITNYSNHDGTVIYYDDVIYSIFSSYTGNGDAANNANCRVVIVGVEESTHNRTIEEIVAKNGDVHGSYTQNGGAGSPNAYLVGTTIHILYTAYVNSAYMMMHCTYDISTGTLSNYSPILVDGEILNNAWFNNRYGYNFSAGAYLNSQANSTIATDGNGTYYIGWCFGSGGYSVGVIFSTTNFVNWALFYDYSDWTISPIYEMATVYKNGYVYFCIRPDSGVPNRSNNSAFGNYTDLAIVGKVSTSDGKMKDACRVYNCGSRPAFFTVSNEIYLFTNPYDRSHGQIIKINTDALGSSEIIAEFVGGYSYPSFFVDGTTIYALVSDNFMRLSRFTLPSLEESDVQTALYNALVV